jgi:LysM repeat protein
MSRVFARDPRSGPALATGVLVLLLALLAGGPARARRLVYTIQPGDTLSRLARRFHVQIDAIRSWNRRYFERHGVLKVGRRIAVRVDAATARELRLEQPRTPRTRPRTVRYRVLPGDTLWHIARRHQVSTAQLRAWNPKVDPRELRPGTRLAIRTAVPVRGQRRRCERVRPGDTLTRISRRAGVGVSALRRFNNLRRGEVLSVGRLLCFHQHLPEDASRAVGKPQSGRLVGGEQLRDGPGYHVKQRHSAYGTNELLTLLYRCLGRVHRRFGRRRSLLVVGDLSRKTGGALGGHVSHQNGTDVDLGYYYDRGVQVPRDRFIDRPKQVDLPRTWTLLHCLIDSGEVQYVFMDEKIQRALYRHARKRRLYPRADLDLVFEHGPPRGRRRSSTIILHVDNHRDHFHVRVFCPRKDVASAKDRPGRCFPSPGRRRPVGD